MNRFDNIITIKGIGEKLAANFKKLSIETVDDLLMHFPSRYVTFEAPVPIGSLRYEGELAVEGMFFTFPSLTKKNGRTILSAEFKDPTGSLIAQWFNLPFLRNQIHPGLHYVLRGRVCKRGGRFFLTQGKLYSPQDYRRQMGVLQPIYPLTAGITNHTITKSIGKIFESIKDFNDYLPRRLRKQYDLPDFSRAIHSIHFPKARDEMLLSRQRLVFDEFFLFSYALKQRKEKQAVRINRHPMEKRMECQTLLRSLPYELTKAQQRVWQEIQDDLTGLGVMNRLVQGDVGSGKTILAQLALLMSACNGYQGSLMVPTEVLARQHYEGITTLFKEFGIKIALLTGSMTAKEKQKTYEKIANHEIDIVIGTHALIQEKVRYDKLGLVITDEQHRFGVKQRAALSEKGEEPHILFLSATPIPRTLSILLYGDLSLSVLDERPANRLPIKNCVVGPEYREKAYRFLENQVKEGRQAYVICPMVGDLDEEEVRMDAEDVCQYAELLKEALDKNISISYLHGKMKPKDKNDIMERFASGKIQILVSTTVVEVGVDVPNATVMMIENAERFGLAQLHQLRGRVGRGKHQSYCIFVNTSDTKEAMERLSIMNQSNDGFFIASEDLRLRGPGDILGVQQSGRAMFLGTQFRVADIFLDASILKNASEAVNGLTEDEKEEVDAWALRTGTFSFEDFVTTA